MAETAASEAHGGGARDAAADPWAETPKHLWPEPTPEDAEFWEGARRSQLRVQRCHGCGLHQHYPRLHCSHCGADSLEWVTASGRGTIHSFTVVRQNGVPPFRDRVPFVVALVDLEELGARLLAPMPTLDPGAARIGLKVEATFRPAGDPDDRYGFVD